jgi:CRP-like cAMP-binding protein
VIPGPQASHNVPPNRQSRNRLLAALPLADYQRIIPVLEVVPLALKHVLYKTGERIEHVYFPGGGFLSVLTVLEDGGMVEISTVGREGMVGVNAVFSDAPIGTMTMVQGETDTCYRMTVPAFRAELERSAAFRDLLTRYAQALMGVIMQSTACNAVHSIEQRLARWLLMAHDRMERDEFPLTQEFVAMMLGTTRPTVTVVAGILQRAELITYRRGQLTILDRERLESASCECYRASAEVLRDVIPEVTLD